jgi:RNA polymerase-interacting CarD/CdnL/TRCF family regulator
LFFELVRLYFCNRTKTQNTMETKFKVGDRVRHPLHGTGTVDYISSDGLRCYVATDTMGEGVINVSSDLLELIEPAPTAAPTPDRAMIAAMCLQGIISSLDNAGMIQYRSCNTDEAAQLALLYTDALIAELQKPKQ